MEREVRTFISEILNELADNLEKGYSREKIKIGVTTLQSEHGIEEVVRGAELASASMPGLEVVLIGPSVKTKLEVIDTDSSPENAHREMERLLDQGYIDGCITMHYNFPIGVATVGRVITPGLGREMIVSSTTGVASSNRVGAMVLNAIYGIASAKALGISRPTVGILNIDGAKQVERALRRLFERGYEIDFAVSNREDGGCIMRGNDLLSGVPDVMVMDTLTGNLIIKIFSAFTTGGSYESLGYAYGPGIGKGYDRIIGIISRASGSPVIANAIRFLANMKKGNLLRIRDREIALAEKAGLLEILEGLKEDETKAVEEIKIPSKKPVTEEITGIDILELDDAVKALWKEGIYAETGMGCTGPVILLAREDIEKGRLILKGYF
ncbi:MAG TPA: glycine reductase [Thermoanaerobacterales bacterium]|nr:glycine reductase [Thermoanaerobacterales bacterium]